MSRYVDADALYEKTAEWEAQALHMVDIHSHDEDNAEWKRWSTILTERSAFKFDIADFPTADVVEVVRCKDCRYWQDNQEGHYPNELCPWDKGETPNEDDFCSFGERRDYGKVH